ncbi:LuxR family transcriptional regulator [Paenibacillus soyae]|uniref:LuxR C-terminal-related transcriptional regulator n=1 Tax=Paenibacillus soyae TaxID=2969249 RepID=A0A9X2MU58_9BACL|nr:LuxR family transcriptional regulator [Paenibacillus soyae]MCR2805908.1 LuxR C-terminal-related transcriptional regulator [Paenibacillus soyae]
MGIEVTEELLSAFLSSIRIVKEHITGGYLFLLTDERGKLTAMDYSPEMKEAADRSPIRIGLVFSEENCGVNAISEAMATGKAVYLKPEHHESPHFQTWHCFATPLLSGDKLLGYLDVSTVNEEMKGELIAIVKLISAHMLESVRNLEVDCDASDYADAVLTERQLDVLRLISEGQTVKSIALKLHIKESTVNHHKKMIFEKLNVQSSAEAVRIASQLSMI